MGIMLNDAIIESNLTRSMLSVPVYPAWMGFDNHPTRKPV